MTTEELRKLARATIEAGKYATTRPWRDLPDGRGFRDVAALDKTMVIEGAALTPDDAAYIILAGDADKLARALLIEMDIAHRLHNVMDDQGVTFAEPNEKTEAIRTKWATDALAFEQAQRKKLESL